MHFARHKRRRAPSVIIVSLIDVLLVVLIFLMVTTTFKREQPALKLNLPQSKQAKLGAAGKKPFVVQVATNAPYLYLENSPVTLDQLKEALLQAVRGNPELHVAIKGDKQAPLGEVIKVIDLAKDANVAGISVITEKFTRTP